MAGQETRVLNYWRKKYLLQVLFVMCVAVLVVWAAFVYFVFFGFILLTVAVAVLVAYLMLKAIKEDLQVRGEGIILARADTLFNGLKFDFGRGVSESVLDAQNVVKSYKFRECHNVMKGNDFILEEDWLYSLISAKFFSFSQTAFQGVVLALNIPNAPEGLKGKIDISKNKPVISGELNGYLQKHQAQAHILALLKLFKASSLKVVVMKGKIYFWIGSETKIFYQFKLFSTNTINAFVKRVNDVQKEIVGLCEMLNR